MTTHSDSSASSTVPMLDTSPGIKSTSTSHSSKELNIGVPHSISGASLSNPIAVATGVYVTVHGHFYQPPRENPYLNAIERQPSAAPFHNWNERIHSECYRPNAFARILNEQGHLVGIVNNFEYLSFNIGPTLMSWLEQHDLETYQRILDADRKSCERLNGHGNAIAQVYNHIILPLANERDKYTQVRWGKADFKQRFGRDPEGMWLAETAVDYDTLKVLVDEGIRFIVLAPSQAQRCRTLTNDANSDPQWLEVGGSQIDPTQPYRCFLPGGDRAKDYIDIFFYDGPISRDMGFNDVLSSSQHLAGRIAQAVRGNHRQAQLISVATDGETFGHHKGGTEKALAYAFTNEFPRRGWTVSNFAHYLSISPPTWEVELKPVTAWSCAHGVDRWQEDCGCGGGGLWHQQWRRPLRNALDWLRDQLTKVFEECGKRFFHNPWKARDEYVHVILDRSPSTINQFLANHQTHKLSASEKIDALRLLEMQRHALLMYTSCGWFFEEVSRPEGTQILRYAARALELAGDVAGVQLEKPFVKRLAMIPSNVDLFQTGAEVYRQLVVPAQITLNQVAAHYAISSLFTTYPQEDRVYCYTVQQLNYQLRRLGTLTLAVGQIQLTSDITREVSNLVFAVLHLGGWDFHCCIQPFEGRRTYSQIKDTLFEALKLGSAAQVILTMSQSFGDQSYNLQSLFAEERQRIMSLLSQETLTRLDQLYLQVYRDNYGVLMAFHRDELDVPQELQVAAEIAIGHRALMSLQALERETSDFPMANPQLCLSHLTELEAIAAEASYLHCQFKQPQMKQTLERLVLRSLWHLLHNLNPATVEFDVQWVQRLIMLGNELRLTLSLAAAQELYLKSLHVQILPQLAMLQQQPNPSRHSANNKGESSTIHLSLEQVHQLLCLGQTLTIDVDVWMGQLGIAVKSI
jgi:alpha-amylase/alpha-mannosidase (GH57 family)